MLKTEIKTKYEDYVRKTFQHSEIKQFLLNSEPVKAFQNKVYENLALQYMTGKISPQTLETMIVDLSRIFCRSVLNIWETNLKTKQTDFSKFIGDEVAQKIFRDQEKDLSERLKTQKAMKDIEEEFNYTGKIDFQGQTLLTEEELGTNKES